MGIKKGLNPRLAEIGKIKIGGKGEERTSKKGGVEKKWRVPIKFDHFKITTTERDAQGNLVIDNDVLSSLDNKEPKELRIRLPFDDIDMNFFTSYQRYDGKKLKCKGDGETAIERDKDGNESEITCNTETCPHMEKEKCKVSGILSCYLPDSPSFGGVYRFRTHSWNSVSNILAALAEFKRNTGGILQGIPMRLKMLKKATEEHGNVNTVTIVLDGIEIAAMRELAAKEMESRKLLSVDMGAIEAKAVESGFTEDTDNPEDIEAEFYSDGEAEVEDDGAGASAQDVKDEMTGDDGEGESEDAGQGQEPPKETTDKDLF